MSNLFIPGQVLGIIGGGHIARMLCASAQKLGFEVGVLDPDEDCPAGQVASWQIISEIKSKQGLKKLSQMCDVVIYEDDSIDEEVLVDLSKKVTIPQGASSIEFPQNRIKERKFLEESNVNIAPYRVVNTLPEVHIAVEEIGFPCILKAAQNGEKHTNTLLIKKIQDIGKGITLIAQGPCIVESHIPKAREVSVIVVGNGDNDPAFFPISEKIKLKTNLYGTVGPVKLPNETAEEIYRIADILAVTLRIRGVLSIEMFINEVGTIYVNHFTFLPKNAGLYTEQACSISQFDAHIRGICGWPIPKVKSRGRWLTIDVKGKEYSKVLGQIPYKKEWFFQFYGYENENPDDIIGHVSFPIKKISEAKAAVIRTHIWDD